MLEILSHNREKFILGLKISLGLVFLWYGLLKVVGQSPVFDLLNDTFVFLAGGPGGFLLGLFEVLIGLGLLFRKFSQLVVSLLILHLLATLTTFFIAPKLMFQPYFPILSFEGEFVFKNIVFIAAALVILSFEAPDHRLGATE